MRLLCILLAQQEHGGRELIELWHSFCLRVFNKPATAQGQTVSRLTMQAATLPASVRFSFGAKSSNRVLVAP